MKTQAHVHTRSHTCFHGWVGGRSKGPLLRRKGCPENYPFRQSRDARQWYRNDYVKGYKWCL